MENQARMEPASDPVALEDRQLIVACLEGDAGAWEALIARYQRLIYSVPLKARLSQSDAADVFQAVCLKLYEKLQTLRDHEKLSSWIITTATRESWRAASHRRRDLVLQGSGKEAGAELLDELADARPLADEQREMLERQQIVRQAVAALPERCSELVEMLFYRKDELSYAEIARRMDMPISSVGPTRARCLGKLRKLLQDKI
jgi:RNA polymerase sigma factor (sigma-70 family)